MAATRTKALVLALCHPTRARLHERISDAGEPVPLEDLADEFDLGLGRSGYHVGVLESFGLVRIDGEGRACR